MTIEAPITKVSAFSHFSQLKVTPNKKQSLQKVFRAFCFWHTVVFCIFAHQSSHSNPSLQRENKEKEKQEILANEVSYTRLGFKSNQSFIL